MCLVSPEKSSSGIKLQSANADGAGGHDSAEEEGGHYDSQPYAERYLLHLYMYCTIRCALCELVVFENNRMRLWKLLEIICFMYIEQ